VAHGSTAAKPSGNDLIRVFVDVDDTPENRDFFRELKARLKERFQQIEIRITSYIIEAW
jgi:hypothetical protein